MPPFFFGSIICKLVTVKIFVTTPPTPLLCVFSYLYGFPLILDCQILSPIFSPPTVYSTRSGVEKWRSDAPELVHWIRETRKQLTCSDTPNILTGIKFKPLVLLPFVLTVECRNLFGNKGVWWGGVGVRLTQPELNLKHSRKDPVSWGSSRRPPFGTWSRLNSESSDYPHTPHLSSIAWKVHYFLSSV